MHPLLNVPEHAPARQYRHLFESAAVQLGVDPAALSSALTSHMTVNGAIKQLVKLSSAKQRRSGVCPTCRRPMGH